ncbi:MAG: ABC transporter permease subunit [Clostridiales bacterium]|nr:ABC transporter permease subunit [Clostridiales bacterium]
MNIFRYEFRMYRKSILIWSLSMAAILIVFMALYPTFARDTKFVEQMLENYPEEMLKAFGMNGTLPLSTILGFLAFLFVFIQLCLAIQAANYGFSILSVEEREFTADYLISKPVSRTHILNAKFGAAFLALIITDVFLTLSTFGAIELYRDGAIYEVKYVVILLSSVIFFQLFFLSIGMAVSVLTKKIRNVLTFSLGISFGTYILNAVGAIIGGNTLKYLSPFAHFEPGYILELSKYDMKMAMISIVLTIVFLIITYILYPRRDIQSL